MSFALTSTTIYRVTKKTTLIIIQQSKQITIKTSLIILQHFIYIHKQSSECVCLRVSVTSYA